VIDDVRAWQPPALAPLLDPAIARLVYGSPQTLGQWAQQHGSPLNVVWPAMLQRNVARFRAAERRHAVRMDLYYAAKVNKSQALVRAAVEAGIGVDVSSEHEMRDALRAGAPAARLVATGPAKTERFHRALLEGGALVSVDSIEELAQLRALVLGSGGPALRVLLRLRPGVAAASRFGMEARDVVHALRALVELRERASFEGFHFHLGGYDVESRVQAVREVADLVDHARRLGLAPRTVDIGGGMPIRYVDAAAYEAFLRTQGAQHYRHGKVPGSFYPYGSRLDAGEWLDLLLESPCRDRQPIARWLNVQGLRLAVEPGRSLADQAAISVFRIARVKALGERRHVLFIEGSSFSACETWFASEFLVDPILVAAGRAVPGPHQAYVAGHSCLDEDVLSNRWIGFEVAPQAGDLLVYANTAGYQMDLLENEFHRHPMPRRMAARIAADGAVHLSPDDDRE
jgi:diaminopimelate decarboxylase